MRLFVRLYLFSSTEPVTDYLSPNELTANWRGCGRDLFKGTNLVWFMRIEENCQNCTRDLNLVPREKFPGFSL